jgi:hypothetical protein
MYPVVDNSSDATRPSKPGQTAPEKQLNEKREPKLPSIYDHPEPLSIYDDMATCG